MVKDTLTKNIGSFRNNLPQIMVKGMNAAIEDAQYSIIMQPDFSVVTGTLMRSVSPGGQNSIAEVKALGNTIVGYIGSNVKYAAAFELGIENAYDIVPKNKQALFWPGASHPVKKVTIPPREGKGVFQRGFESGISKYSEDIGNSIKTYVTQNADNS